MTAALIGRTAPRHIPRSRRALGALGMLALPAGLCAALLMLGLQVPTPRPDFAEVHGPLMVLGFVGTLIALNEVALLCFVGVTVSAVVHGRRHRRATQPLFRHPWPRTAAASTRGTQQ